jgi:hypothetical protein
VIAEVAVGAHANVVVVVVVVAVAPLLLVSVKPWERCWFQDPTKLLLFRTETMATSGGRYLLGIGIRFKV